MLMNDASMLQQSIAAAAVHVEAAALDDLQYQLPSFSLESDLTEIVTKRLKPAACVAVFVPGSPSRSQRRAPTTDQGSRRQSNHGLPSDASNTVLKAKIRGGPRGSGFCFVPHWRTHPFGSELRGEWRGGLVQFGSPRLPPARLNCPRAFPALVGIPWIYSCSGRKSRRLCVTKFDDASARCRKDVGQ